MNLETRIASIGEKMTALMALFSKEEKQDIKLSMAAVLNDGTNVLFEPDLNLGAFAFKTDGDGTVPLADGVYLLESNDKQVEIYDGKVANVSEVTAKDNLTAELEAKLSALPETIKNVEVKFAKELDIKLAEQSKTIATQSELIKSLYDIVVELSKAKPTREVVTPKANADNPEDRIDLLMQSFETLKNN